MVFKNIANMVLGDPLKRVLSRYQALVSNINHQEDALTALDDAALRGRMMALRARVQNEGAALDDLLPDVFALVREAAKRAVGLRPYDVQLIGGAVLHSGKIAEMRTGEGKTLVASLPLVLNALTGRGVHLVTPNDYLSKVGLQQMGPIYHLLGLTAGVIQNLDARGQNGSFLYDPAYPSDDDRYRSLRPCTRGEAYAADITYGTNNEFGFDYLRDNMTYDPAQRVQRDFAFAIVDEVDNILIDEARTPLIISGPSDPPSEHYKTFTAIVRRLKLSSQESVDDDEREPDGDYVVDLKDRVAYLTEAGVEKVERALGITQLYHPDNADLIPYLDNCLRAYALHQNDRDYVVTEDGQVVIVDEFTGRLMHGRRFSEGLHQAIEAKEGVTIRRENVTMATVTFQNFFRKYDKLAGMTGTAATEAEEFFRIYGLEVVVIPTHRPIVRNDQDDLVYLNEAAKFRAVVDEIRARHGSGQPVLVGTASIDTSERLSKLLAKAEVTHQVLNAKQHEREATVIAQAGRPSAVTIATNMAGRGVDILLGGNPEGVTRDLLRAQGIDPAAATPEQWSAAKAEAAAHCAADREKVLAAGGLYVLGTERHEARRIDNQLRGRAGRQGDPGESRFYLSLEDDLMKRFGGDRVKGIMSWVNMPEDEPIEHGMITRTITQAQVRVEGHNFDIRKRVLEYDDVVNLQRESLYKQRQEWLALTDEERRSTYIDAVQDIVVDALDEFQDALDDAEDDDAGEGELLPHESLYRTLLSIFPVPESITPEVLAEREGDALETLLEAAVSTAYDAKTVELGEMMPTAERQVMLMVLDQHWQRHLTDLDMLREGIGLMSVAQRDPLVEYKRQAYTMWQEMLATVKRDAARMIFRVRTNTPAPAPRQIRMVRPTLAGVPGNGAPDASVAAEKPEPARATARQKLGPNDPCWCGSGNKYKKCHQRADQQEERDRARANT